MANIFKVTIPGLVVDYAVPATGSEIAATVLGLAGEGFKYDYISREMAFQFGDVLAMCPPQTSTPATALLQRYTERLRIDPLVDPKNVGAINPENFHLFEFSKDAPIYDEDLANLGTFENYVNKHIFGEHDQRYKGTQPFGTKVSIYHAYGDSAGNVIKKGVSQNAAPMVTTPVRKFIFFYRRQDGSIAIATSNNRDAYLVGIHFYYKMSRTNRGVMDQGVIAMYEIDSNALTFKPEYRKVDVADVGGPLPKRPQAPTTISSTNPFTGAPSVAGPITVPSVSSPSKSVVVPIILSPSKQKVPSPTPKPVSPTTPIVVPTIVSSGSSRPVSTPPVVVPTVITPTSAANPFQAAVSSTVQPTATIQKVELKPPRYVTVEVPRPVEVKQPTPPRTSVAIISPRSQALQATAQAQPAVPYADELAPAQW